MIDETLHKLEERIRSGSEPDASREELLALVAELRSELTAISETHGEDAVKLARHAQGGTETMEDSILEFETAHPRVVQLVRSVLRTLSDAGI